MKVFLICLLLVAYTQATSEPEHRCDRAKVQTECFEENGWSVDERNSILKEKIYPVGNERVNDLVLCIWRKLDLIDENDAIDLSQVRVTIPTSIQHANPSISKNEAVELANQAVDECNKKGVTTGNSLGQNCVLLLNCLVQYVADRQN
ncbi:hypothetical protein ILUMI_13660 [Ignelater luminosus]|uniref:Uncharacterized protein n=1 Tax=Ignelater luminosus TaxID=2038154 RepID=A0A8K0GB83_IGNLU|nr:hypothetical protein ILUMI_13660 [Ignelater luminosus]